MINPNQRTGFLSEFLAGFSLPVVVVLLRTGQSQTFCLELLLSLFYHIFVFNIYLFFSFSVYMYL